MFRYKCNVWDYVGMVDAICVTTNGCVKNDGKAVMGKGIALEARLRYPRIDDGLGKCIKKLGNHVSIMTRELDTNILSFPTKTEKYMMKSEIWLIKQSCIELMTMIKENNWKSVLLPCPGCNNGGLNWKDVEKEIEMILDHKIVYIVIN